jgi:hypothetical protein
MYNCAKQINKITKTVLVALFFFSFFVSFITPVNSVFAQKTPETPSSWIGGFVPCGQTDSSGVVPDTNQCGYDDLLKGIARLIYGMIYIAAFASSILFSYAGFKIMTSGGDTGALKEGKDMMRKVLIGFVVMLAAWSFVKVVESTFIDYNVVGESRLSI